MPPTPLASYLLSIVNRYLETIDKAFDEIVEKHIIDTTDVRADIERMSQWLIENPEVDIELGSTAKNYVKEMNIANEMGIDLEATFKQDLEEDVA